MEDDLKKKWKTTSFYFFKTRITPFKKWKTTSKKKKEKKGRRPQKRRKKGDLKNKIENEPMNQNQPNWL